MTAIERIAKVTAWDDEEYVYEIHEITFADLRLAADCIDYVRGHMEQCQWIGNNHQHCCTGELEPLAARIKEAS